MKLHRLAASYPGLAEGASLSLHEGLNVVNPAEAGSGEAWCSFIETMLYGPRMPAGTGETFGGTPAAALLEGAGGNPAEGVLELTADHRALTVTRTTQETAAPMQALSVRNSDEDVPVEGIRMDNAGEELAGVSRIRFHRTAVVHTPSDADASAAAVQALLRSGEESCSSAEGEWTLSGLLEAQRGEKGVIPEAEAEVYALQKRIHAAEEQQALLTRTEDQLYQCRTEEQQLEERITAQCHELRRNAEERRNAAREELSRCRTDEDEALKQRNAARQDLQTSRFGTKDVITLQQEASADAERIEALRRTARRRPNAIPLSLCFLLAVIATVLYENVYRNHFVIIAAAVLCLAAVSLSLVYFRRRKLCTGAGTEIAQLLEKYEVESEKDIPARVAEHQRRIIAAARAEQAEQQSARAVKEARERLSALTAELNGRKQTADPAEAERRRRLLQIRQQISVLSQTFDEARAKLATAGNLPVLRSQLASAEQRLQQAREEAEALELAADALRRAGEEAEEQIAPEMEKLTVQYLTFATGRHYECPSPGTLQVLSGAGDSAVKTSARSAKLELFAARLAASELSLPHDEVLPLLLPDGFSGLNEAERAAAGKLVRELALRRQVIVFSEASVG